MFELIEPVLMSVADLGRDEATGECGQISVTLGLEAVPAFVYE